MTDISSSSLGGATSRKDPWLAANLSWTFAGLGQFYAGRKGSGALFLVVDVLGLGSYLLWLTSRDFSIAGLVIGILGLVLLRLMSLLHARAVTLKRERESDAGAPSPSEKNPWLALFMSRIIPGLGHAYAARRGRAVLGFLFLIAWSVANPKPSWEVASIWGYSLLTALFELDSFRILREKNRVPRRVTMAALGFILVMSQTYAIGWVIRTFAFEVFRIPSSSMEPTLLGNVSERHRRDTCPFGSSHVSQEGDRILVSKLAYLASPLERFDLVVFHFPLNQSRILVSRVVGMPGEDFQIHRGDLYGRRKGEKDLRILRKPVATQDSLWIPLDGLEQCLSDSSVFRKHWELISGSPGDYSIDPGRLVFKNAADARFALLDGIEDGMGQVVDDARISIAFDFADPGSEIFARRRNRFGQFDLRLTAAGKGELTVERSGGIEKLPFSIPAVKAGTGHTLELWIADGLALARVDGAEVARKSFIEILEDSRIDRDTGFQMSFGMSGGRAQVSRLEVGRDLYYRGRIGDLSLGEDQRVTIPESSYLMMGDNVSNSHDSRAWIRRTFTLKDGRKIVCEAQQICESYSEFCHDLQDKLRLPQTPDLGIDGDEEGREVPLFRSEIASEGVPEPFRFVERRFIVGRVQKIWWPLSRARGVR